MYGWIGSSLNKYSHFCLASVTRCSLLINTWPGLTKPILLPMTGSPIFLTQIQSYIHDCTIRFSVSDLACDNYWSANSWPLAICIGSLRSCWHHGWPVVSFVRLSSLMVLDKDLWCSFANISSHRCQAYFTLTPSQYILFQVYPCLPASLSMVRIAWYSGARVMILS